GGENFRRATVVGGRVPRPVWRSGGVLPLGIRARAHDTDARGEHDDGEPDRRLARRRGGDRRADRRGAPPRHRRGGRGYLARRKHVGAAAAIGHSLVWQSVTARGVASTL